MRANNLKGTGPYRSLPYTSLTAAYSTTTHHLHPHFCALLSRLIYENKKLRADTPESRVA
ncbi:hypothetical protein KDAU_64670 [Dictyobacter aurantiacus]|uniref:Uncharacterized protein n=1 Tax=Dictyobacter aurantiacus TaxID=1936993 RepID=A0A401ZQF6_9CHLR|nr:hypothetical protein KDAU_64670 [Dictyobacter aurantiacus]